MGEGDADRSSLDLDAAHPPKRRKIADAPVAGLHLDMDTIRGAWPRQSKTSQQTPATTGQAPYRAATIQVCCQYCCVCLLPTVCCLQLTEHSHAHGLVRTQDEDCRPDDEAASELENVFRKSDFARMAVVGQFNLGFIIARLDDELFIIDQHAADEKYNFERLQAITRLNRQPMMQHQLLEVTPAEAVTLRSTNSEYYAAHEMSLPTMGV